MSKEALHDVLLHLKVLESHKGQKTDNQSNNTYLFLAQGLGVYLNHVLDIPRQCLPVLAQIVLDMQY